MKVWFANESQQEIGRGMEMGLGRSSYREDGRLKVSSYLRRQNSIAWSHSHLTFCPTQPSTTPPKNVTQHTTTSSTPSPQKRTVKSVIRQCSIRMLALARGLSVSQVKRKANLNCGPRKSLTHSQLILEKRRKWHTGRMRGGNR